MGTSIPKSAASDADETLGDQGREDADMTEAIVFGLLGSSALVLGALVGGRFEIPKKVLAGMLAFASGALITALAFELFEDAHEQGGLWRAALGLLVGAAVFTFLSARLDRLAAADDDSDHDNTDRDDTDEDGSEKLDKRAAIEGQRPAAASVSGAAGLALLAAVTLDGVPENIALGVSLGGGTGGIALLGAIFVSNFPEALVGSASMRAQGWSQRLVLLTWTVCALLLTAAVVIGAGPLANSSPETISLPLAFAAGAVLASLADTLMPEAYEEGGPTVALATAAGFVLSYLLATL
jgi:zinc transporter, ZIP family